MTDDAIEGPQRESEEIRLAVGRAVIAWGRIEEDIDYALAFLWEPPLSTTMLFALRASVLDRLELACQIVTASTRISDKQKSKFGSLAENTRARKKERNKIVHSMHVSPGLKTPEAMARYERVKGKSWPIVPLSVDDIHGFADKFDELHLKIEKFLDGLSPLPDK